jgi:hypothetical protein
MIPDHIRQNSLPLITRFDKLINDNDRKRVCARVAKETNGLFAGLCPISLTQALAAEEGGDLWESSGAHAFYGALVSVVERISEGGDAPAPTVPPVARIEAEARPARPRPLELAEPPAAMATVTEIRARPADPAGDDDAEQSANDDGNEAVVPEEAGRIVPRRVRPSGFARTPRPSTAETCAIGRDRTPSLRPGTAAGPSELEHMRAEFRRPEEGAVSN